MLEIHRNAIAHHGLHLPGAPFGAGREVDPHTWFDGRAHGPGANVASMPAEDTVRAHVARYAPRMTIPPTADLDLARMVGLRLCHDLGGVVGTIANALDMMPGVGGEAATLAQDAAEELRRRLILWRAMLGGQGEATLGATLALLDGQLAGGRAVADAGTLDLAYRLPEEVVPVVLAAMLLGGEALARGGRVCLGGDPAFELAIWPDGPRAAWPPTLLRALAGEMPADALGRDVTVVWLCTVAAAAKAHLSIALPPGQATGPLLIRFAA